MRRIWPRVSVVIPNRNGRKNLGELLDRCLHSLIASDYPDFEVIIVDNASTDDSVAYLKRQYHSTSCSFKIVSLGKDHGYAGGINAGVRATDPASKYILVLTTDVIIKKTLMSRLVSLLEKDNSGHIASAHPLINDRSQDMLIGELYVQYPGCDPLNPWFISYHETDPVEVSFPSGEVFIVRKDVFLKVRGFDEKYYLYCEDLDLGLRMRLEGYRCLLFPNERVIHYRSKTNKKELSRSFLSYIIERNRLQTCIKILSRRSLAALAFCEAFRLLGLAVPAILGGQYRYKLMNYLRAVRRVRKNIPSLRVVRKDIQKRRTVSDRELFGLMRTAISRKPNIPTLERLFLAISLPLYWLFA